MEVAAVGMEGALPVEDAAGEGEYRVRKRHRQREHRQDEGYDGVEFEHTDDRGRGEDIAQQQGAGIAHEYLRGVEIIRYEAETAAAQGGQYDRDVAVRVGDQHGNHQHRQRGDRGHAAGEAVEPVDQVNGVCHADDPEYSYRHREDADGYGLLAGYQQRV